MIHSLQWLSDGRAHQTTLHTQICKHHAIINIQSSSESNHLLALVTPHAKISRQRGMGLPQAPSTVADNTVELWRRIPEESRKTTFVGYITNCWQTTKITHTMSVYTAIQGKNFQGSKNGITNTNEKSRPNAGRHVMLGWHYPFLGHTVNSIESWSLANYIA